MVVLDHDEAGKKAFDIANKNGVIQDLNTTFFICEGMPESELEDCINVDLYKEYVCKNYGVRLDGKKFKNNKKWSVRMKDTFSDQVKIWNQNIELKIKSLIVQLVQESPETSLIDAKSSSIKALVNALENKLSDSCVE